mmetsp:Transcript_40240/g.61414  ORF Transcript_40240/g.61414 Transcript_40240/m.61414 type:complete len:87 (+) Transcript_40240:364-624(+)
MQAHHLHPKGSLNMEKHLQGIQKNVQKYSAMKEARRQEAEKRLLEVECQGFKPKINEKSKKILEKVDTKKKKKVGILKNLSAYFTK